MITNLQPPKSCRQWRIQRMILDLCQYIMPCSRPILRCSNF
jgi:hypothetical protein